MSPFKNKLIALLIVYLSSLALLAWVAFVPVLGAIKDASEGLVANQEILVSLNQKESSFRRLERNYEEEKSGLINVSELFIEEEEIVDFVATLENIAGATGNYFEITMMHSHQASENDPESYLNLQISLWGDFRSILEFVANLEDSPYPPYRLMNINSIVIKPIADASTEGTLFPGAKLKTMLSLEIYTKL